MSVIKRVVIEPVTRVEGHGKVTILIDEAGKVVLEQKVASEPEDIVTLLSSICVDYGRIGIEAPEHAQHFGADDLRGVLHQVRRLLAGQLG